MKLKFEPGIIEYCCLGKNKKIVFFMIWDDRYEMGYGVCIENEWFLHDNQDTQRSVLYLAPKITTNVQMKVYQI